MEWEQEDPLASSPTGRRLLGKGGKNIALDPEFECDDPESLIEEVNFPNAVPGVGGDTGGAGGDSSSTSVEDKQEETNYLQTLFDVQNKCPNQTLTCPGSQPKEYQRARTARRGSLMSQLGDIAHRMLGDGAVSRHLLVARRRKKKADKKAERDEKKADKKAERDEKKADIKAKIDERRAAREAKSQELCCPRSGQCFEFCHEQC